jgi:predicted GNAT superfamily acetyltransferase
VSEHAEAAFGGLSIRTCHTVGEFRQVLALQKEVWGFEDAELVPVRMFVVGEKIGGHVIGAFNGQQLVCPACVTAIPTSTRTCLPCASSCATPAWAAL